ncbi:MAG: Bax inhibitor-1 family protein [bacterium]
MEYGMGQNREVAGGSRASVAADSNFLRRVFAWMFSGLIITGVVSALISSNESLMNQIESNGAIVIGVIVAQLALVLVLIFALPKISPALGVSLFFLYAATVGVTFAIIFQLYTTESVYTTFGITALMFGSLAAWGYFTDIDLTRLGPILFGALIGLILATIVNIFVASSALYWITTYAGVIIFAGLTAYDMQKLKRISEQGVSGVEGQRLSIYGALSLYLDFINLFLFLLRIFGQQR